MRKRLLEKVAFGVFSTLFEKWVGKFNALVT